MMHLERYVDYGWFRKRWKGDDSRAKGPREPCSTRFNCARLLLDGTQWVPESAFQQAIQPGATSFQVGLTSTGKLADLFARDLLRVDTGRDAVKNRGLGGSTFTSEDVLPDDEGRPSRWKFGVRLPGLSPIRGSWLRRKSRGFKHGQTKSAPAQGAGAPVLRYSTHCGQFRGWSLLMSTKRRRGALPFRPSSPRRPGGRPR